MKKTKIDSHFFPILFCILDSATSTVLLTLDFIQASPGAAAM